MSLIKNNDGLLIQKPINLLCEYNENPIGLDIVYPRFSWTLQYAERGSLQTAYRILVAATIESLQNETGDMWDSGKVNSFESVNVEYAGKPLQSKTRYYWKAQWWNNSGSESSFSETAFFEMGLLAEKDWAAKWIGGGDLLRNQFTIADVVKSARAYISGLGWYELMVNGKKVGDHQLDPGQTDYDKTILYSTYDISDYLRDGENVIGVMLGKGRYAQDWSTVPLVLDRVKPYKDNLQKLILQVDVQYSDGSSRQLITDKSWKTNTGPIVANDIYNGETYDARLERIGWDSPGYNDSEWKQALLVAPPGGKLVSQTPYPPIKMIKTMQPSNITNPDSGVYVYDFGQNFTGWVRLVVNGPRGTAIKLRFSEVLHPGGMINVIPNRTAQATDIYILKGEGPETYEPRFTYHGFRYVEVTGFPGTPNLNTLQGKVVHSAVTPAGGFQCSNDLINQIHQNIIWTQVSNLMSIPTDCPQRNERMGWMGDAQLIAEESIFNFDMAAFYSKWLRDIRDSQKPDGSLSDVVPAHWQIYPADPPWGTACIMVPWNLYLYYDDIRVLKENYQVMKGWVDFLTTKSEVGLVRYSKYGDWCPPGKFRSIDSPGELVSSWCYYHDASVLSKIAQLLGKFADADKYSALAQTTKEAFNREFLEEDYYRLNSKVADVLLRLDLYPRPDKKNYLKRTLYGQTANVLPLYLEMVPDDKKNAVLQNLFENVEVTCDCHLNTGILGTRYLLDTLTRYGRADLAYKILTQTTYPGWGYMIKEGATTLWERWEHMAGGGMNSHNHIMFGSIDAWLYKVLAGITIDSEAPGFGRVKIKPHVLGNLKNVSASVKTIRGLVASSWKREQNSLVLYVTLPVNCAGSVSVPVLGLENPVVRETGEEIFNNGCYIKGAAGITAGQRDGDYITFSVGSGTYSFFIGKSQ